MLKTTFSSVLMLHNLTDNKLGETKSHKLYKLRYKN